MSSHDGGKPPGGPPHQGWGPPAAQPQQPHPGWAQPPPPQPQPQGWGPPQPPQYPPFQPPPAMHRTHLVSTVAAPKGAGFVAMAMLSMKRAFRLRIEPNEILEDERFAMARAKPPIADETQQAFLAWRRSVLFMAALFMIPLALLHSYDETRDLASMPPTWQNLTYLNVLVEIGFTIFLWTQVGRWTRWRKQSRALSWMWLIYFLTPFLMFLYPLASAVKLDGNITDAARHDVQLGLGALVGAQALFMLAPKVISLLQGLIRASIATKTLFPGAAAPGWLMVIAAPLYMIIFYLFVLLPYHFTGSGLVVGGLLLVLTAKSTLVRAGLGLTRPMTPQVAHRATHKALTIWMLLLIAGVVCIVAGLWSLLSRASALSLVTFALSMAANVLVLTLIATDTLITGLDRARGTTADERKLAEEAAAQVAAFTGAGTA